VSVPQARTGVDCAWDFSAVPDGTWSLFFCLPRTYVLGYYLPPSGAGVCARFALGQLQGLKPYPLAMLSAALKAPLFHGCVGLRYA
jgi:hypothetical protein